MAQQANVTLDTVVYAPNGTTNGVATWTNRSAGFGAGFTNITEKVTFNTKGNLVREEFTLDVPIVLAADTGFASAGTLLRTSTIHLSIWLPGDSTSAERLSVFNRLRDLAASAPMIAAVQNLDPAWG